MKRKVGILTFLLLLVIFIVWLPSLVVMNIYHEEKFTVQLEERITAEPVKSLTNQFSENLFFGGAGGLASTEIELASTDDFLNKTAGEKVYSSVMLADANSRFIKLYLSLIKDRSGVYTYYERYYYPDYEIADFDGRIIYFQKNNVWLCLLIGVAILIVDLFLLKMVWSRFVRFQWV